MKRWATPCFVALCLLIGFASATVSSAATYQYDTLGRLISVQQDDGAVLVYHYDQAGNVTSSIAPGLVQFSPSDYTVWETDGNVTVTVNRIGGSDGPLSLTLKTADGTATAGSDYTAASKTVTWFNGNRADKQVVIPILPDSVAEGMETFEVRLSNFSDPAVVFASQTTATVSIQEKLPSVTTLPASAVVADGATLNVTVNPNGLAATAHFDYGLTTDYGTSTANKNAGSGNTDVSLQEVLGNLTPNTTYHFRAVATNINGTVTGLYETFTTPDNASLVGTWAERTVARNLPAGAGSVVDIGTLTFIGGTGSIEAAVNASGSGWSVAKRYVIPIRNNLGYGSPPATWLKVLPTHDTGASGVNDFDLDLNVSGATALLRLRTVGNSGVAATARIAIKTTGLQDFANSTATAAVAAPTLTVFGNAVDELKGTVGIGIPASGNSVMEVNGGDTRGLRLRPRSTPGAPATGTWYKGTIILDSAGDLFICTALGTPGTWQKVGN